MKPFKLPPPQAVTSGIVSLYNWTVGPTGDNYLYFYCDRWEVITDKAVPIEGFRSGEHWQLAAVKGDDIVMLIPGCKVQAWVYCPKPPTGRKNICFL